MINDKEHWDQFYSRWSMSVPSQFCVMAALDLQPGDQVVEFGCGNGRDALFFSRCGARVLAFDASKSAIDHAASIGSQVEGAEIEFKQCDVGNAEQFAGAFGDWRSPGARTLFYARFFLHSVDEETQDRFLHSVRQLMRQEDILYLEFRTSQDATAPKEFGQHYRRYINPRKFAKILEGLDFEISYSVEGHGMAVFKGEDAHVARFVASPIPTPAPTE